MLYSCILNTTSEFVIHVFFMNDALKVIFSFQIKIILKLGLKNIANDSRRDVRQEDICRL